MPKKNVSFESDVLKTEFAQSKTSLKKNHFIYLYIIIAIAAIVAVVYFVSSYRPKLSVDWEAYGKALASLEKDYSDYSRVIIKVGDNEIAKEEYYKLKIMDKYTFDSLMIEYYGYIDNNDVSAEEREELKPKHVTDEEIIDQLIRTEVGYLEAMEAGIYMNYAMAYSQISANYKAYQSIIDAYESTEVIYQRAAESMMQMQLVATGMGITVDEYLEYLANDSIKMLAAASLEEQWQEEFEDSEFDGTVDEYIDAKYEEAIQKYSVENYGL